MGTTTKYAKSHNINRYNFYGGTGVFSNEADGFLVFNNLKRVFNAHVEELIGDFIKPVRPFLYKFGTHHKGCIIKYVGNRNFNSFQHTFDFLVSIFILK